MRQSQESNRRLLREALPSIVNATPEQHDRAAGKMLEKMRAAYRPHVEGGIVVSSDNHDTVLMPRFLLALGVVFEHAEARDEILAAFSKWNKRLMSEGGAA